MHLATPTAAHPRPTRNHHTPWLVSTRRRQHYNDANRRPKHLATGPDDHCPGAGWAAHRREGATKRQPWAEDDGRGACCCANTNGSSDRATRSAAWAADSRAGARWPNDGDRRATERSIRPAAPGAAAESIHSGVIGTKCPGSSHDPGPGGSSRRPHGNSPIPVSRGPDIPEKRGGCC